MDQQGRVTIDLTHEDLLVINNALNEICHGPGAIQEWEFQTRIGVEKAKAHATLDRIKAALGEAR